MPLTRHDKTNVHLKVKVSKVHEGKFSPEVTLLHGASLFHFVTAARLMLQKLLFLKWCRAVYLCKSDSVQSWHFPKIKNPIILKKARFKKKSKDFLFLINGNWFKVLLSHWGQKHINKRSCFLLPNKKNIKNK